MDKLAAKARVEQTLGREWVIPTLWSGGILPESPPVLPPAMLKARHRCNQFARDEELGGLWSAARTAAGSTRARLGGKQGAWTQIPSSIATTG
ncbi:hypothetical protein [Qipengyuania sp.]|uniref:hypothetical protein n=1 Tax=Qipengyuania sp. TaxID=2004515 RepID=UPI0035C7F639